MYRIPQNILIPIIVSMFMIGFIGIQTNWIVALTLFVLLVGLPVSYFVTVYYVGTAMTVRGDIRGAIEHYTRILELAHQIKLPVNRVFLHTRRAALHNALGNLDGAIKDYSAAMVHAKQEIPEFYGIRSALYLGKRDYEHALEDSNRLLELSPQSEIGYANRAAAKMFLGDVEGAITDCTTGLDLNDKLSSGGKALLYNNRGTAYRIKGEYSEAMSNYNLAMGAQLKPQQKKLIHPSVMTNQGILYYLMGDPENARVYFQRSLETNDKYYKALAGLAVTRFKLEQFDEAKKLWQDLLKVEPRYRDVRMLQRDLNLPNEMMEDVAQLEALVRG